MLLSKTARRNRSRALELSRELRAAEIAVCITAGQHATTLPSDDHKIIVEALRVYAGVQE